LAKYLFYAIVIGVNFMLGATPWALILGRLLLGADIRRYGDRNPGTYNVLRAGGIVKAAPALLFEVGKGLAAGLIAQSALSAAPAWIWVAGVIAPIAGHAFTPFLRFRGGKALAVTLGVWAAIAPLPVAVAYGGLLLVQEVTWKRMPDAIKVSIGMLAGLVAIRTLGLAPIFRVVWAVNWLIMMVKQWQYGTLFVGSDTKYPKISA